MANEVRLIDANAIYEAVEQRYKISSGIEHRCERALLDLICAEDTVDAVEVVRCKDCAFCKIDNSVYMRDVFGNENDTPQYHCLMGYGYNKPDHFCSYGERRNDGSAQA